MKKRILLITATSSDHWIQLFRTITSEGEDDLTIISPALINCEEKGQMFDVAFVDSTKIEEMEQTVADLRTLSPMGRITVLSTAPGWREARDAIHAGADDYRLKSYDAGELRQMILSSKLQRPRTGGAHPGSEIEELNGE
jgi:hypothetical protein